MILRPYQSRLVERALDALGRHDDTLAVAATGAGKTICLSALGKELGGRQLVLQHRQELVRQNMGKYKKVHPKPKLALYTADAKGWGDVTFAMQPTLARNLGSIPPLDVCMVDEAHHAVAPTFRAVLDAVLDKNPDCKIVGFTATPERGDRKSLRQVFSNVCDQVTIGELVALGFLVPPKAYVVDAGGSQDALRALGKVSEFGDQRQVEEILGRQVVTDEVLRHWKGKAADRQTIVFASTVHHAELVAEAFRGAGVSAACVHGQMPGAEREALLERFDRREIRVLTNVAVLTEGFDSQPCACVILLRQCSEKGPLIQMVGRGLRTVDPELHPGVVKRDCVVLDFGVSLLTHGDLNTADGLHEERERAEGDGPLLKVCPTSLEEAGDYKFPDVNERKGCGAELPAQTRTCPLCGFAFERDLPETEEEAVAVELTELNIMEASPFRWCDLFASGRVLMASGFEAWAGCMSPDGLNWFALGFQQGNGGVHTLRVGEKVQAMAAADDFLREHETEKAARKSKRWLDEPATDKQLGLLLRLGYNVGTDLLGQSDYTKYSAACHANFQFARKQIERALGVGA